MKYILVLLVGVALGGVLVFYFLVGAPRTQPMAGAPVRAPEAGGNPPGTAVLMLDEKFFNTLLGTVFNELGAPTFKLAARDVDGRGADGNEGSATGVRFVDAQCISEVVVLPEGSGVNTGVRLADGKITLPLAFNGSYNLLGNCTNFRGWAQANVELWFVAPEQKLNGRINVEGVNLDGVSPIFAGVVTQFVQNSINQRVNPLVIMQGAQLALDVPVQATGGTLKAQAQDIRSEVKDGALRLHVTYDFSGERAAPPPSPPPPTS